MFDVLCVTNRALCREEFSTRVEKLARAHPAGIILREKDLTEEQYRSLAAAVMAICKKHGTPCILHCFVNVAKALHCEAIHLPLPVLRTLSDEEKAEFTTIGASCHSVEDAMEAEARGCTYITAGHIFDTDCKKDLPGRGLPFLKAVCESVSIPVYAIGGIDIGNLADVRRAGARGACVMSSAMVCDDVKTHLAALKGREG